MQNHAFWRTIANAIVPQSCVLCRAPSKNLSVCEECTCELPWMPSAWISPQDQIHPLLFQGNALRGVMAALQYAVPVDRFIHALKYQGHTPWVHTLAVWIQTNWPEDVAWPAVWVPIPLHPVRYRERGFNQSLLLARALATLKGGRVEESLLVRVRATSSAAQQGLSIEARAEQLEGCFAVNSKRGLPNSVCLVDDVLTTGATLSVAARTLKNAGVNEVMAAVVARAFLNAD